jgi:hypothetical protein
LFSGARSPHSRDVNVAVGLLNFWAISGHWLTLCLNKYEKKVILGPTLMAPFTIPKLTTGVSWFTGECFCPSATSSLL